MLGIHIAPVETQGHDLHLQQLAEEEPGSSGDGTLLEYQLS